jgi:hypothetical protein
MTVSLTLSASNAATQLQPWRNSPSSSKDTDSDDAFAQLNSSVQAMQSNMFSSPLVGGATSGSASGADSVTATGATTSAVLQNELASLLNAATGSSASAPATNAQSAGGAHHGHHHAGASDSSSDSLTPTADQLIDPSAAQSTSATGTGLPQFLLAALADGQSQIPGSAQANTQSSAT